MGSGAVISSVGEAGGVAGAGVDATGGVISLTTGAAVTAAGVDAAVAAGALALGALVSSAARSFCSSSLGLEISLIG